NEVARADAAVAASIARERLSFCFAEVNRRRSVQILGQLTNDRHLVRHVFVGDLRADLYPERRSDWLAKLQNEFAGGNIASGKTMSGWNSVANFDERPVRQNDFETRYGRLLDDCNIVIRVDDDGVFTNLGACRFDASHKLDLMV